MIERSRVTDSTEHHVYPLQGSTDRCLNQLLRVLDTRVFSIDALLASSPQLPLLAFWQVQLDTHPLKITVTSLCLPRIRVGQDNPLLYLFNLPKGGKLFISKGPGLKIVGNYPKASSS